MFYVLLDEVKKWHLKKINVLMFCLNLYYIIGEVVKLNIYRLEEKLIILLFMFFINKNKYSLINA
jgi:hypothetical protein